MSVSLVRKISKFCRACCRMIELEGRSEIDADGTVARNVFSLRNQHLDPVPVKKRRMNRAEEQPSSVKDVISITLEGEVGLTTEGKRCGGTLCVCAGTVGM